MRAQDPKAQDKCHRQLAVPFAIICLLICCETARAEDAPTRGQEEAPIIFIPPSSGAPADRLGAGTRDVTANEGPAKLLAPPAGGISATAKPLLVWHFGVAVDGPVTVAIKPIGGLSDGFVATLQGRFPAGFHGLDLRRSGVELAAGQLYQWEVSAGGLALGSAALIEYRTFSAPPRTAGEAANQGLWYDALAALFAVDFSGRLKLEDAAGLRALAEGAALDLTKILDARK